MDSCQGKNYNIIRWKDQAIGHQLPEVFDLKVGHIMVFLERVI